MGWMGWGGKGRRDILTHPCISIVQRAAEGYILFHILLAAAHPIVTPGMGNIVAALCAQQGNNLTTTTHAVCIACCDHTPTAGDIIGLNEGGIPTTGSSRSNSGHPIRSLTTDRAAGHCNVSACTALKARLSEV